MCYVVRVLANNIGQRQVCTQQHLNDQHYRTANTCTSISLPSMKFIQVTHDCILLFRTEKPASHHLSYAITQQNCTNITNIHVDVTKIWFPGLPTLWGYHQSHCKAQCHGKKYHSYSEGTSLKLKHLLSEICMVSSTVIPRNFGKVLCTKQYFLPTLFGLFHTV